MATGIALAYSVDTECLIAFGSSRVCIAAAANAAAIRQCAN